VYLLQERDRGRGFSNKGTLTITGIRAEHRDKLTDQNLGTLLLAPGVMGCRSNCFGGCCTQSVRRENRREERKSHLVSSTASVLLPPPSKSVLPPPLLLLLLLLLPIALAPDGLSTSLLRIGSRNQRGQADDGVGTHS
jgi:hypothetical protein